MNIGATLFLILILITCAPIITGVTIAILIGAVGLTYFTVVMTVSILIWFALWLILYI